MRVLFGYLRIYWRLPNLRAIFGGSCVGSGSFGLGLKGCRSFGRCSVSFQGLDRIS